MYDIVVNFNIIDVFILFKDKMKKNKVKVTGYDKRVDIKGIREVFSKYGGVQFVYQLPEGCVVTFTTQATAEKVLKQEVKVSI